MPRLSYSERKRLRNTEFALPDQRKYPIENISHARNALARVSAYGSPTEKKQVRGAVHKKYPGIGCATCGSHSHMIHPGPTPKNRDYSFFGALDNLMNKGDYF